MAVQEPATHRRLEAGLGIAAVTVSFLGIFVAAALSPWFSPFAHALSDLGERGVATAPVFNGGLLVGGALGAGFVVALWTDVTDGVRRASLVFLLLAMVFLGLTGAVPLPTPFHGLVALAFFFFMTVGVFVWGAGDFVTGRPVRGGAFVVASTLHVAAWAWRFQLGWTGPGIAIPELVGAGALAVWAVWLSVERWPESVETEQL